MRRRGSETRSRIGGSATRDSGGQVDDVLEMRSRDGADRVQESDRADKPTIFDKAPMTQPSSQRIQQDDGAVERTDAGHTQSRDKLIDESSQQHLLDVPLASMPQTETGTTVQNQVPNVSGTTDLASTEWSYLDTQGMVQGELL